MVLTLCLATVGVLGVAENSASAASHVHEVALADSGVRSTSHPNSVPDQVGIILKFARAQLGKPYIWGGTGSRGFDCSGLVMKAFAAAGVRLPRGSIAQATHGKRISKKDLRPGDLVFSHRIHVQIYIGGGKVIEAARPGTKIRISHLPPDRMIQKMVRIPLE
jgi:cell wall-associated NlpC family hydrolase